jgi:hypothetical protein
VADALAAIANEAPDEIDSGGARVMLPGGRHLRLGGTVWPLLACAVTLAIAPLDPTGLTFGAAGAAIINALDKLKDVLHSLDPAQRVVVRAVADVSAAKQKQKKQAEAGPDELRAYFQARSEMEPRNLDDLLKKLAEMQVLKAVNYPDAGVKYHVTW